jgi:hypothetical protein
MRLNAIILDFQQNDCNVDIQFSSEQLLKSNNEAFEDIINNSLSDKMSQVIQNFSKINIKEVEPLMSLENYFGTMVDEIIHFLEDTETKMVKHKVVKYLYNHNVALQEIYYWLLSNQDIPNFIFLLGVFNHFGIEINVDKQNAFKLYQKAANLKNLFGITSLGLCFELGIGTKVYKQNAFKLYQKAANLGNVRGIYYLGNCYRNGIGTSVDNRKAFESFQKAANLGSVLGMVNLGNCYFCGIGINDNKQKAVELFQKAANLGNYIAQHNLAFIYKKGGGGVKQDINKAIYWYRKSAEQGHQNAQNKLNELIH